MNAEFDQQAAHRFFSAHCFNAAWELIDQDSRSDDDRAQMLSCAMASLWHWSQRPDDEPRNRSIGYWQVSRVYALLGYGEPARWFAQLCLETSRNEAPFFLGYAYECLARAAALCGESEEARRCLDEAAQLAESIADESDRQQLLADLKTISA
jgi:hypothetical protein